MAELWAIRRGDALWPDTAESAAILSKLPMNKPLRIEAKNLRNGAHHRIFFVLVHRIANALDVNPEALRDHLTVSAGHYYEVKTKQGIRRYPKSISWASLDQSAFSDFFERVVKTIYENFGIERQDVLDAVADVLVPEDRIKQVGK